MSCPFSWSTFDPWVNWDTIYSVKKCGGLGVGRTREFNIGLLDKWWLSMHVARGYFWYKVLVVRYGEEGGG